LGESSTACTTLSQSPSGHTKGRNNLKARVFSLFLGLSKRRYELKKVEIDTIKHRKVLSNYTLPFLDQMNSISTACVIISYTLYTVSEDTLINFGTNNLILTIPFVIYGIFRYLYLINVKEMGGNPAFTNNRSHDASGRCSGTEHQNACNNDNN